MNYFKLGEMAWLVLALDLSWLACLLWNLAYKRGQIDAINKNIKFVLTTNADGETMWTGKRK